MSLRNKAILLMFVLTFSFVLIKHIIFDITQFDVYPMIVGSMTCFAICEWYDKRKLELQLKGSVKT